MVARKDRAQAELDRLDRAWTNNEDTIADLSERLELQKGNLGELFGVTRQVAGDASTTLGGSLITTQIETPEGQKERSEFLREIAGATALPDSNELRRLWYEIFREMVETGRVVRYTAPVAPYDPALSEAEIAALPLMQEQEVVRVGPFTAVRENGEYLGYLPGRQVLTQLSGQLGSSFRAIGRGLLATEASAGYTTAVVDPASGALLGLYVERPNWLARIEQGEVVGYVIVAVGVLGVAVALVQAIYLVLTRAAVSRQLRNLNDPRPNNPLGRVLLAFRGDGRRGFESAELAELRISEAVLREIPRLERFQSFLRLAVAAGPLLGLIGTVIGMIITFKAITASGSSDPKLMAQGIGQAMIATVLGLGIAIPLLFINSGLAAMSRGITQTLDEQSHSLLAERANAETNPTA
jgi:biopolymer transport protein ExbB